MHTFTYITPTTTSTNTITTIFTVLYLQPLTRHSLSLYIYALDPTLSNTNTSIKNYENYNLISHSQ